MESFSSYKLRKHRERNSPVNFIFVDHINKPSRPVEEVLNLVLERQRQSSMRHIFLSKIETKILVMQIKFAVAVVGTL